MAGAGAAVSLLGPEDAGNRGGDGAGNGPAGTLRGRVDALADPCRRIDVSVGQAVGGGLGRAERVRRLLRLDSLSGNVATSSSAAGGSSSEEAAMAGAHGAAIGQAGVVGRAGAGAGAGAGVRAGAGGPGTGGYALGLGLGLALALCAAAKDAADDGRGGPVGVPAARPIQAAAAAEGLGDKGAVAGTTGARALSIVVGIGSAVGPVAGIIEEAARAFGRRLARAMGNGGGRGGSGGGYGYRRFGLALG